MGWTTRPATVAKTAALVVMLLASGALTSCAPTQSALRGSDGPLPVEFTIFPWARALGSDPLASPPGANDYSCRPTAAHPNPVVLVHGFVATAAYWQTLAPLLINNGYCVYALTYGQIPTLPYQGGFAPMEQSAAELATFVDQVLAATGATKVDLVGHSEGTLMPEYWLKRLGGAGKVDKFVALGAAFDGTSFLGLDTFMRQLEEWPLGLGKSITDTLDRGCPSCRQLLHDSDFIRALFADGVVAVPGITYTTILSRIDELVVPYTAGRIDAPGVTNIVVQDGCEADQAEHGAVAWTPRAAGYVLNALDPTNAVPPPCEPTAYGIGAVHLGLPGQQPE